MFLTQNLNYIKMKKIIFTTMLCMFLFSCSTVEVPDQVENSRIKIIERQMICGITVVIIKVDSTEYLFINETGLIKLSK